MGKEEFFERRGRENFAEDAKTDQIQKREGYKN
jgi:hypothetical protein